MATPEAVHHHTDAPDTATPLEKFLEANFKKILIGFAVMVIVIIVAGLLSYNRSQTAAEAAELVTAAKTVEDCDIVVQRFPGTTAAGDALLMKSGLLWDQNKKDSAVAVLREFIKSYDNHPLVEATQIQLASRLESMGEKAEARGIYQKFESENSKSEFAPAASLRLADMLWEEGKVEEAKAAYQALPGKYPGNKFISQSEERQQWLSAGLPTKEVDPPPPPPGPTLPAPGAPALGINPGIAPTVTPGGSALSPAMPAAPAINLSPALPATGVPMTPDKPGTTLPAPAQPDVKRTITPVKPESAPKTEEPANDTTKSAPAPASPKAPTPATPPTDTGKAPTTPPVPPTPDPAPKAK